MTSFFMAPSILFSSEAPPPAGLVSINDQAITQYGGLINQRAGYRLNASGIVEARNRSTYSTRETWLTSGSVSDYVAYVTATGDALESGTLSSEIALSTSPEWVLNSTVVDEPYSAVLTVQIRNATTHAVLDTATVTLTAERI